MDEEYHLGSEDEPVDDEATIEEQEKQENDDHQAEIDRLQVAKNITAHNVRVSVMLTPPLIYFLFMTPPLICPLHNSPTPYKPFF